jgi:hypothetical protein
MHSFYMKTIIKVQKSGTTLIRRFTFSHDVTFSELDTKIQQQFMMDGGYGVRCIDPESDWLVIEHQHDLDDILEHLSTMVNGDRVIKLQLVMTEPAISAPKNQLIEDQPPAYEDVEGMYAHIRHDSECSGPALGSQIVCNVDRDDGTACGTAAGGRAQ